MNIKPQKGMQDYLPEAAAQRDRLLQIILETYTASGFTRIYTPAVESAENLDKSDGGDNLNLIFRIMKRGDKLKSALDKSPVDEKELCDLGLRYDLTLPLSRYYANNRNNLPEPFKCIQIDKVYRAERPQRGRLREFVQCDIDILGMESCCAEIELISVTTKALQKIGIGEFSVRVNDRRVLRDMLTTMGFAEEALDTVSVTFDKLDKIGVEGIRAELTEKDKKELKPIEKIRMVMTRNKDDEPELYEMLGTKEDRKELDRQFKNVKSNFKIAIVVDMWLTGFDVPSLDTIYIDKPIQQHTLIQTISRVNRVCEGKDKGLIVDYIGIKKNMNLALKKYTNFECEEFEGVDQCVVIVKDQLEVLGQMFHNFNSKDYFQGSPTEQLTCLNRAVEYVQLSEELERRFMAAVKRMKLAFNLCSASDKFTDEDKDYIHFYCGVRSILFKLTKGDAPDIAQMNARVREMLEGAIQSDGIEELFETGKHISVDIFSDEYMDKINAIPGTHAGCATILPYGLQAYGIDFPIYNF